MVNCMKNVTRRWGEVLALSSSVTPTRVPQAMTSQSTLRSPRNPMHASNGATSSQGCICSDFVKAMIDANEKACPHAEGNKSNLADHTFIPLHLCIHVFLCSFVQHLLPRNVCTAIAQRARFHSCSTRSSHPHWDSPFAAFSVAPRLAETKTEDPHVGAPFHRYLSTPWDRNLQKGLDVFREERDGREPTWTTRACRCAARR